MANPSYEDLVGKVKQLEEQLDRRRSRSIYFKVSEKGGVSLYGLGRFPVTLYYEQWMKLLEAGDELRSFLEENKKSLKLKES